MEAVKEISDVACLPLTPTIAGVSDAPMLPENIIAGAVKYTKMVQGTAHAIPNDQILPQFYNELGWS